MRRLRTFIVALVVVLCVHGWPMADRLRGGTGEDRGKRSGAELVSDAMQAEIEGDSNLRKELLTRAVVQSPQHAPGWWQSGYVRQQNQWLKYSEVPPRAKSDRRLEAYRQARTQYPDTVEGQLALANWCAARKLTDQQRAHLSRVLELDPDNVAAHDGLGHRMLNGMWHTAEEYAQSGARMEKGLQAMREWGPRLERISDAMSDSKATAREKIGQKLLAIRDPGAIGPMEKLLATKNEELAMLVVRALEGMAGHEASLALARQAVLSPWQSVRDSAAGSLARRPMDHYVPALMASMSTRILSRLAVQGTLNSQWVLREEFYREGQDRAQRKVFETTYRSDRGSGSLRTADQSHVFRDMTGKVEARQAQMDEQNSQIDEINDRVAHALAVATGVNRPADPNQWWQWWNEFNEVYTEDGYKPVDDSYENGQVTIVRPMVASTSLDCLAAKTPVWTEYGLKPVEEIVVGDRVLAQDVQSGELAYKPVLRTTVRPASQLVAVQLDREQIRASGGHAVWVSGQGWVKVRDLSSQAVLHGVTDPVSVVFVQHSEAEPTYNLVVADFHTYFVGSAKVLTHDNTVREPTDAIVPGMGKSSPRKPSMRAGRASTASR